MSETLTEPGEFERLSDAKPGATWAEHAFRALMEPEELARYERIVQDECGSVRTYSLFGENAAEAAGAELAPTRAPLLQDGGRFAVALLYKLLYRALGRPRPARTRRREAGEPLRVLRIASSVTQGGVAKVCLQTLLRMPAGEVHNGVLVFNEKGVVLPEVQRRPNIELLCRKMMLFPKVQNLKMLRAVIKAMRMARRFRPDIIHLHEPQLAPVARLMQAWSGAAAVCVHLHNDYNERQQSIPARLLGVTQHALRRCRLIACSQTIHDAGVIWLGKTAHPIELIEDGADDIKQPASNADRLGERLARAAGGRRVVAMMTHLVPHKRIGDFLNACRILLDEGRPIYVLLMAYSAKSKYGRATRRRFSETFAPQEGEFLFRVPDAPRLLPHVDIGVTTSVLEGLGLNVLEFQVESVPVVCTDIKPHREMVEDGVSGLLFPPLEAAACAQRIRELLDSPELARRIGAGGRAAAARRKWQDTADHTVRFYKDILAAPGA